MLNQTFQIFVQQFLLVQGNEYERYAGKDGVQSEN